MLDFTLSEEQRNIRDLALMNSQLPERYGGAGASYLDGVLIGEELALGLCGDRNGS